MMLESMTARGILRRGEFLGDGTAPQYVHVAVLDEIQRRQLRARRVPRGVATPAQFAAFLLRRHHLHPDTRLVGPPGVLASLELLQGVDLPARVWEQEVLSARVEGYERAWLDRLGLSGEIVWTTFTHATVGGSRPANARIGVALRENLGWLRDRPERSEALAQSNSPERAGEAREPASSNHPASTKNILLHLQLRGASFAQDLARVTGLTPDETHAALWELFRAGLVASPRGRRHPRPHRDAGAVVRREARDASFRSSADGAPSPRKSRSRPKIVRRRAPICSSRATVS
jgi:ATP-dependent helicase Lhr and Lhr-like helicase